MNKEELKKYLQEQYELTQNRINKIMPTKYQFNEAEIDNFSIGNHNFLIGYRKAIADLQIKLMIGENK